MEKNHGRRKGVNLNLVSLMDIFTILVFFLLVNSSEVEVLPNAKDMQLPESVAEEKARESVVVLVTNDHVLVQGQVVADIADIEAQPELVIAPLERELRLQTERLLRRDTSLGIQDREVTIMADRSLQYDLLKRVMASATAADYGKISLAVLQKAPAVPTLARAEN